MKNIIYQISYEATSVEEFRSLIEEFGESAKPTIAPPVERGPNETKYVETCGKRLRLTLEEQGRVTREEATRESIAAERLESAIAPASSDSVMDGPALVRVDDGEDLT